MDGGTLLSVGKYEQQSYLWNTSDGTLRGLTQGYVTQAAFSPNGKHLVTGEPITASHNPMATDVDNAYQHPLTLYFACGKQKPH
jgi:hypothetical protein